MVEEVEMLTYFLSTENKYENWKTKILQLKEEKQAKELKKFVKKNLPEAVLIEDAETENQKYKKTLSEIPKNTVVLLLKDENQYRDILQIAKMVLEKDEKPKKILMLENTRIIIETDRGKRYFIFDYSWIQITDPEEIEMFFEK